MLAVTSFNAKAEYNCALTFSRGIQAIRHLPALLGIAQVVSPGELKSVSTKADCVLVWGRKENTREALAYASRHQLPVLYLEDGWIRSCSANAHSRVLYSIQIDHSGVYYDSTTSCDLEQLLQLPETDFSHIVTAEGLAYAARCRELLVANDISKYNYVRQKEPRDDDRPLVMVIDQTRDDASVRYGGMDEQRFKLMLDAAIDEHPQAQIIVRTHPDVVAGKRKGYLDSYAGKCGIAVQAEMSNPIQAIKQADAVYSGTSQLGYEALLCDKPVVVFGQPFYAGWGIADERSPIPRRTAIRNIDELFYATHIAQSRYCNPVTGQQWQLHECLEHVQLQQRMFKKNARRFHCVGITPWKRRYIAQFLRSPDGSVEFDKNENSVSNTESCKVTWSYRVFGELSADQPQRVAGVDLARLEDGFLRSRGLGSDFNAPASLVVDFHGLYFDPARSSDLERLLNNFDCTPADISRAVSLKKLILSARLSKYNVGSNNCTELPSESTLQVLVVGQVEDDESIQRGCSDVGSNAQLLQSVKAARPDAWIVYKPHPDVVAGNRRGAVEAAVLQATANQVDENSSIIDCIERCNELHTMTSLSGFEALMRGTKVVTYGSPFYAGWGLTEDRQQLTRRKRRRTLDELIFLTLIEYPRYLDIDTGEFIPPEDLVVTIKSQNNMNKKKTTGWSARQLNKAANIVRGLRYAP